MELFGLLGAVAWPAARVFWPDRSASLAGGTAVFVLLAVAALFTNRALKTEARWYSARALSECLKSESWRFIMRNPPYAGADGAAAFSETVRKLTRAPLVQAIAPRLPGMTDSDCITADMSRARALNTAERRALYDNARVAEAREWYLREWTSNRRREILWVAAAALAQVLAFVLAILAMTGAGALDLAVLALTMATSATAWNSAKHFGSHSQSYANISSELRDLAAERQVESEADLADFVDNVENLVSREHTIWVARKKIS